MYLASENKLLELWKYSFAMKANVILMRHAPKSGSDESGLSEEGGSLAMRYGNVLRQCSELAENAPILFCTAKVRTQHTLNLLFPSFNPSDYRQTSDLRVNKVTPFVQDQTNEIHKTVGCFRGYYGNHTYYFLEKLGGRFDEENIHTEVAERMAKGIKSLFSLGQLVIYCGHSPGIEVGLKKLLGITLSELGGFLNPLDSMHLRMTDDKVEWVARINPIVDYVDLENETYFGKQII